MTYDVSNETYTDPNADIINVRRLQCLDYINGSQPLQGLHCEAVFDGWSCWPATFAGKAATSPCPNFVVGFDPARNFLNATNKNRIMEREFIRLLGNPDRTPVDIQFVCLLGYRPKLCTSLQSHLHPTKHGEAHKECTANGTWFRHPESGQIWSNYTTCVNLDDLNLRQHVNNIYQAGYFISLLALLISLFILSYFKSLRCPRNTLHMNLFTSFAFNNFLWLLWYRLVIPNPDVIVENGVWCQCLHVILHYFLISSYAWMLAEGVYLHTLLVSAFTSEQKLVKVLTGCSWLVPFFFTGLYTTLRLVSGDTQQCWIDESDSKTVLIVLVATSMLLNLMFLCNIVRVVVTKLRAGPSQTSRPSTALLQALRATLLLLPLLGLNYLLTPFRPPDNHPWETYYEIVSALTASFQGLCVATLFCFCNGEVIAQMKRKWQYTTFRTRANSYTTTTVSFVRSTAVPTAEEEVV